MSVYSDRLILVQTAIADLLATGQSVSFSGASGGRSLQNMTLKELTDYEKELQGLIAGENAPNCARGRARIQYVTPES